MTEQMKCDYLTAEQIRQITTQMLGQAEAQQVQTTLNAIATEAAAKAMAEAAAKLTPAG